jgi:AcrR family transcriptional regulator|tara:strand:- start:7794 stop:8474 length:681 start_codon:yes stop_codon:yes gene_type:complete
VGSLTTEKSDVDDAEPKRRKDGRLTKAERTKVKILQSAEQIFAEHGYEGTTLDAVGEPVDVLGTAVLYHFKNKQVLYQETLKYVFKPLSMRVAADFDGSRPLEEMLTDIGLAMIQYSVERPTSTKLFMREAAAGTPESLTVIGPVFGKTLQNMFDAVGDQKAAAKLAKLDPVFMVATLIGLNGFYFSGFPTLMGERLSYDPYEPERLEQLKKTIRLLVKLLIKAAS